MSDDRDTPEHPIEQNPPQNNLTPSPQLPKSEQDELHERLIFEQDLNEVHLLIDFVSGRADRNLASLTMPNPLRATPQDSETLSAAEVVRRIAEMRYPPDPKTPAMNAKNAALLLMAKDRLSQLADPARGFHYRVHHDVCRRRK